MRHSGSGAAPRVSLGREPRLQLHEVLAQLAAFVDSADADSLSAAADGVAQEQKQQQLSGFVETLKRHVALLKAQNWRDFDFHAPCALARHGTARSSYAASPIELLWTAAVRLWNLCISYRNRRRLLQHACSAPNLQQPSAVPGTNTDPAAEAELCDGDSRALAWVQSCAAELTALVPEDQLEDAHVVQRLHFCRQAGQAWLQLGELDQAEIVLSQGVAGLPVLLECLADAQAQGSVEWEEQVALAFDLQVLHLRTLWLLGQEEAAAQLRSSCCAAALGATDAWTFLTATPTARLLSLQLCGLLSSELLSRAEQVLEGCAEEQAQGGGTGKDAMLAGGPLRSAYDLLTACHDLLESGLGAAPGLREQLGTQAQAQLQDTAARLHVAKQECLLTMMAVHVSARDGARALQCYQAAARDLPHPAAADSHIAGSGGGGDGGSGGGGAEGGVSNGLKQVPEGLLGGASCLALKVTALALAQRLQEAEQELMALVVHGGATPELCMDAVGELLSQGASLSSLRTAVQVLQDRISSCEPGSRSGPGGGAVECEGAQLPVGTGGQGGAGATAITAGGALVGAHGSKAKGQGQGQGQEQGQGQVRGGVMLAFATLAALDPGRQEGEYESVDQLLLEVMGPGSDLACHAGNSGMHGTEGAARGIAGAQRGVKGTSVGSVGQRDHSEDAAEDEEEEEKVGVRAAAFTLLWNQAVLHFAARRHDRVLPLLRAAALYCPPGGEEAGRVWRTAALSSLALRQYDEVLESLDVHERDAGPSGGSVANTFIRLKVQLSRGDETAALQQVQAAYECCDFEPAILEVMCHEAHKAGFFSVAKSALIQLQAVIAANGADTEELESVGAGLTEGTVLRLLVRFSLEEAAKKAQGDVAARQDAKSPVHTELAKYFNLAANRLQAVGHDTFFGVEADGGRRSADLEWLASMAWNCAQEAGNEGDYESCTVMLAAYASLLGNHPCPTAKHQQARRTAYLLAASSAIQVHKARPAHAASLALASSMIASSRRARAAVAESAAAAAPYGGLGAGAGSVAGPAGDSAHGAAAVGGLTAPPVAPMPMDEIEACCVCHEVEVALRRGDAAEVRRLLSDPSCLPDAVSFLAAPHLLQLAEAARRGPYEDLWACQCLYRLVLDQAIHVSGSSGGNAALAATAAAAPIGMAFHSGAAAISPAGGTGATQHQGRGVDGALVSRLVRELVLLASRDDERLRRYEDALTVISTLARRQPIAPTPTFDTAGEGDAPVSGPASTLLALYPEPELRWLVTSCWNRGCHHRRLSRPRDAVPYLRAAVRMLQHFPAMAAEHEAMMGEQLRLAEAEAEQAGRAQAGAWQE